MPSVVILFAVIIALLLMSIKLFNSLRAMEVKMGVGVVLSRYENPLLFWLVIVLQCLVIGVLLAIIFSAFFILPNQIMS